MRVVLAPDSFKGSLTAQEAASAMVRGARRVFPDGDMISVPLADGGEGTVDAMLAAAGGEPVSCTVTGPLGEPVQARFGLLRGDDGPTAVIEMAAASGLLLVPPEQRDPRLTTTRGTGDLIRAALDLGARRIILGIGGSATNDGGAGMAQALGAKLMQADGTPVPPGGAGLLKLDRIDLSGLDPRLQVTELWVACDVDNPLTGPEGAAAVYGAQKGATPEMIPVLDRALGHLAQVMVRDVGQDVAGVPGAGAAGGLGAGLMGFLGATLRPGVDLVLDVLGFDRLLAGADLVVTGEGRTDRQTMSGKTVLGVARRAAARGVPVIVLSGAVTRDADSLLDRGVSALLSIADGQLPPVEAMDQAAALLERTTAQALRLVRLGSEMRL